MTAFGVFSLLLMPIAGLIIGGVTLWLVERDRKRHDHTAPGE